MVDYKSGNYNLSELSSLVNKNLVVQILIHVFLLIFMFMSITFLPDLFKAIGFLVILFLGFTNTIFAF